MRQALCDALVKRARGGPPEAGAHLLVRSGLAPRLVDAGHVRVPLAVGHRFVEIFAPHETRR